MNKPDIINCPNCGMPIVRGDERFCYECNRRKKNGWLL